MHIREASNQDCNDIRKIYLNAFPEVEGKVVSKLAIDLLKEKTSSSNISFVAESHDKVVGHVSFSPVNINNDERLMGYILAPLAVIPAYQGRHIGSKLVDRGMEWLTRKGVNLLFVYGDPEYYGRFGFNSDVAEQYIPPYQLQYPFGWQAMVLNGDINDKTQSYITCVNPLNKVELW